MKFRLESPQDWEKFSAYLAKCNESAVYDVEIVQKRVRTNTQNNCIHDYCELMSESLNESGYTYIQHVDNIAKNGNDVPWSKENFKVDVWHRVQKAMFPHTVDESGNVSTARLETHEVSKVYEVVNAKMANYGVSMQWPDKYSKGN